MTTDEPWSSYRKLNAGVQRLANMLAEAQKTASPASFIPDAQACAQELVEQAKTVETAAMARCLTFYRDTYLKTAGEETMKGYDPSEVMVKLVDRTNQLIEDITPAGGL